MSSQCMINEQKDNKAAKKQFILKELKKKRCRITSQRNLIIDIILENKCSCCKEIYYQAVEQDATIGIATVYRMLALLEEIGVINRKNMYRVQQEESAGFQEEKVVLLSENKKIALEDLNCYNEIRKCLKKNGIIQDEEISIVIKVKRPDEEGMNYYD